ncbi:uncharacterized protein E0L32_005521 [Thyridium curvatum]|uniref:Pre-mRNA-splicing factor 18 n=1 Tax=Thyridium curvatum TaxID=1093900 RepID=A0A507AU31_9PEZI|nr:uncharacterized protein E0L32_005521 [Thyridium curvatum]TPX14325.1 hypothetical protein E0L32_005521 [Thyridium curvatum]
MDFASLMSAQIAKAKGETAKPDTSATSKKFTKNSEAEEKRRAAYLAEQRALEEERQARAAAKRKREEDAAEEARAREEKRKKLAEETRRRREEREAEEEKARRRRLGLPELPPSADDVSANPENNDEDDLEDDEAEAWTADEVRAKLRELGHPATLFGEADAQRLKRYRRLTRVVTQGPIPTTLRLVEEKDMKVPDTVPEDKAGRRYLYRQLASYFTMVLGEWEKALQREARDTLAGKAAYNAMVQSKETMKPLFRKFEKGDLDDSILKAVVEIVKAAQERRYVDANDGYLRLSIGKAAWPIGVTMVGIHERSAREKLHNGERGHVMGDEVTRKFLQSIKRCLTFAQVRWPPEDVRQLMG